jgi:hypothetical protein
MASPSSSPMTARSEILDGSSLMSSQLHKGRNASLFLLFELFKRSPPRISTPQYYPATNSPEGTLDFLSLRLEVSSSLSLCPLPRSSRGSIRPGRGGRKEGRQILLQTHSNLICAEVPCQPWNPHPMLSSPHSQLQSPFCTKFNKSSWFPRASVLGALCHHDQYFFT